MALHVVNEAQRCLNCKKPQCRTGCPINTPIPEMIQDFLHGKIDHAGEMLFENNPLSVICSMICDHESQCEGHCILGKKGRSVHISSIENYISDTYFDKLRPKCTQSTGMRAAIIGAGPAGITIAIILAMKGYDITIFESRALIGGVLRFGIPDFRLPKTLIDKYRDKLLAMGIKIRPNTTIGGALSIDDLFRDDYRAVFIGTGVWRPKTLGIRGESLGNVHFALDYLCNPAACNLGDELIVIGGGNSAMDVARSAMRKGVRHVTVYLRSNRLAASGREVDYAMADGVKFEYYQAPVEIKPDGVVFCQTEMAEDGKVRMIPGTEHFCGATAVIIAVSQGPKDKIVSTTSGIEANKQGLIIANESGHTTREGIFAAGDVVLGAKTVVEAVRDSKLVAEAMHQYMQSLKKTQ